MYSFVSKESKGIQHVAIKAYPLSIVKLVCIGCLKIFLEYCFYVRHCCVAFNRCLTAQESLTLPLTSSPPVEFLELIMTFP